MLSASKVVVICYAAKKKKLLYSSRTYLGGYVLIKKLKLYQINLSRTENGFR